MSRSKLSAAAVTERTIRPSASAFGSFGVIAGGLTVLWTAAWILRGGNAWQPILLVAGAYAVWCLSVSRRTITVTDAALECRHFLFPTQRVGWDDIEGVQWRCWFDGTPSQALLARSGSRKPVKLVLKLYRREDVRWLQEIVDSKMTHFKSSRARSR